MAAVDIMVALYIMAEVFQAVHVVDFPVAEVDSVEAEVPSVAEEPQEVFKL